MPIAQSGSRRTGTHRSELVLLHRSCCLRKLVRLLEGGDRVTTGKDKFLDAGCTQGSLLLTGASCQIDMSGAGRMKGLGGFLRAFGVDRVGRADTGERRTGSLEGGRNRGGICQVFRCHGLDTAGLEETPGKGRARGEIGRGAEVGEE